MLPPSTQPLGGPSEGHGHEYGLDGLCRVSGCGRRQPPWLDVAVEDLTPATDGPQWGQRIALVVLALAVTFGGLHAVGQYVSKKTEAPSVSNGYLDLPPEVQQPVSSR